MGRTRCLSVALRRIGIVKTGRRVQTGYDILRKSRMSSWRFAWAVFFRMLCTCTFTVDAARLSSPAMFWLSLPSSTMRSTSVSRAERP